MKKIYEILTKKEEDIGKLQEVLEFAKNPPVLTDFPLQEGGLGGGGEVREISINKG